MAKVVAIQKSIGKAILAELKEAGVPHDERKNLANERAQGIIVSLFDEVEAHALKILCDQTAVEVHEEEGSHITKEDIGLNPYKILEKELARIESRRRTLPESLGRIWAAIVRKHQKIAVANCLNAAEKVVKDTLGDSYVIERSEEKDSDPDELNQEMDDLMEQMAEIQKVSEEIDRLKLQAAVAMKNGTAEMALKFSW